jgi:CubicO group peptidase (beta-lactamase class C family)
MQLRERGLVDLGDPIVRYLPELRRVHNPHGSMDDITLWHLLTHSSGFRGSTWPWGGNEPWHPHEPTEWSQLVAMIPYTDITFPPGSRYSYSNPGSIFIGRTIEEVTGDVYEAYIDKNIFRPLDMRQSYFDVTPWHLEDARSNNYRMIDGQPVANGLDFNTGITVSNGGLNAPVTDMAKWVSFLMYAPSHNSRVYEQVLKPETIEAMWQPALPHEGTHVLGTPSQGLHFFLYDADGHRIVGHTGSQKSFRSFIYLAPDANAAIIGAYNTAGGDDSAPDTAAIYALSQQHAREHLFPLFWGRTAAAGSAERSPPRQ